MSKNRRLTILFIIGIFVLGVFVKCYYIKNTETWERQHDVISFGAEEGHAAYIEYILNNKQLPDFDPRSKWAFFQPPLHHIISAEVMKLSLDLGADEHKAQENTQLPTCAYMVLMTLLAAYMFIKAKGVTKLSHSNAPGKTWTLGMLTVVSLIGLHPMFILLSGSINNDTLALFLSVVALVVACAWYEKPSILNTVVLALFIGLSMIAKLTGGLVAVPIGILMLMKFFGFDRASRRSASMKNRFNIFFKEYFIKALLFALIVFPLGLSFTIYNKIKWDLPINYIPYVGEIIPEEITLKQRLFDISTKSVYALSTARGDAFDEYNLPLAIIKTSLFSEFNFSEVSRWMQPLTLILFVSSIILAVIALIATFYMVFAKKSSMLTSWKIALLGTYITYLLAYLSFALQKRTFSATDFRYAAICIVCEGIFTGLFVDTVKNKKIKYAITVIALIFAISAGMIYGLLCFKA